MFVGPYDLSGSMGIPGDFDNPKFIGVIDLINRKAVEHRITMGFHEVHPSPEKINKLIENGVRFIACGIDTVFLIEKSKEFAKIRLTE